ncbi:MAG TPA: hypothetical protein VMC03_02225 [Streptosporangiaceae bacterium]|nr:hypothetical protein [Streptosporangiaceae bacterium]
MPAASKLRSPLSCSSGAGPTISGSGRLTTRISRSSYGTRDRTYRIASSLARFLSLLFTTVQGASARSV